MKSRPSAAQSRDLQQGKGDKAPDSPSGFRGFTVLQQKTPDVAIRGFHFTSWKT